MSRPTIREIGFFPWLRWLLFGPPVALPPRRPTCYAEDCDGGRDPRCDGFLCAHHCLLSCGCIGDGDGDEDEDEDDEEEGETPTPARHGCHDARCPGVGLRGHGCHNLNCDGSKVPRVRDNVCPTCGAGRGEACAVPHVRRVSEAR